MACAPVVHRHRARSWASRSWVLRSCDGIAAPGSGQTRQVVDALRDRLAPSPPPAISEQRVVAGDRADHAGRGRRGRSRSRPRGPSPVGCGARPGRPNARPRRPSRPAPDAGGPTARPAPSGISGIAYAVSPPGTRTLMAPSSSRSRDTVDSLTSTPSAREQFDQVGLVGDAVLLEQSWRSGAGVAPCSVGRSCVAPVAVEPVGEQPCDSPRAVCMRLWAWGQMRLCGPSSTSSVASSPRCAGRQCRKIASGCRGRHQVGVHLPAGERLAADRAARPPGPSSTRRRCRRRRRRRPRRGGRRLDLRITARGCGCGRGRPRRSRIRAGCDTRNSIAEQTAARGRGNGRRCWRRPCRRRPCRRAGRSD